MMLPTHAVVGLALAAPLLVVAPDHATLVLGSALVGSVFPDLDLYAGHRRTLHFPTGYALAAIPALIAAGVVQSPPLLALAIALLGATLHCRMDRYGGGLELRPWEATSDRAVYDHVRRRWRRPKRWVRYDGAPEDVALLLLVGAPLLVVLEGPFRWIVGSALLIGGSYGLLRRRLAGLAPRLVETVPEPLHPRVPDRYHR